MKKIKISFDNVGFEKAQKSYKSSKTRITALQVEASKLGVELTDKAILKMDNPYTEILDLAYEVATKGFTMPKMNAEGFLKLQGMDLTALALYCSDFKDVQMSKPSKEDFTRYTKSVEERERVLMLEASAEVLTDLVAKGIIVRPEMLRQISGGLMNVHGKVITYNTARI